MVKPKNKALKDLTKEIEEYKSRKKTQQEIIEKEELEYYRKETEFIEKEKGLLGRKKEIYGKILEWKDDFIKTKQFKDISDRTNLDITIYNGNWGHKISRSDRHGCWSQICLSKSGDLVYWAGYKWMPTGPRFTLNKNNAMDISYEYLQKFYEDINQGNVYKTIAKQVKRSF